MNFERKQRNPMEIAQERIDKVAYYMNKGLSRYKAEYLVDIDRIIEQGEKPSAEQRKNRGDYLAEIDLD